MPLPQSKLDNTHDEKAADGELLCQAICSLDPLWLAAHQRGSVESVRASLPTTSSHGAGEHSKRYSSRFIGLPEFQELLLDGSIVARTSVMVWEGRQERTRVRETGR